MIVSKAARRYAKSLLELAKDRDEVESVLEDMSFINNTMQDSRELVLFVQSPIVNNDDKQAVLEELFAEQVQESTRLFLKLLVKKDRINILDQIAQGFIDGYRKYAGIIEVTATVAYELSDEQRDTLHQKLEQKTGLTVELSVDIDESIKGGLAVRIDDTVIDGTVKHQLQELEEQLLTSAA